MSRTASPAPLLTPLLNPTVETPLFRQLYDALRGAILTGTLRPGGRLPATRTLAVELGVSRNTVVTAYEQLLAEGYLSGRVGSGTYITHELPEHSPRLPDGFPGNGPAAAPARALSQRGERMASAPACVCVTSRPGASARAFRPGIPALDAFPFRLWERLALRRWRTATVADLGHGDPAGYLPLRAAIAAHVGPARAVRCTPEQVIIVAGTQQGLDLVARVLLDEGDAAWVEEPGYVGAKAALIGAGVRLVPVPVNSGGLDVAEGVRRDPTARLAYVTPSHQYPLGMTMCLPRRLALLDWARQADAWVLEDDYDSEFRYSGRPLAALQGLDRDGRVIYLGTFSKALFPALRLGYLIVPPALAASFTAARAVLDQFPPTHLQAVVADFLTEGHFARHIRQMRTLYAERQAAMVNAVRRELAGVLEVEPSATGINLPAQLPPGVSDAEVSAAAARAGIEAPPMSAYYMGECSQGWLLLGYGASTPKQIREGVRRLAEVLAPFRTT